MRSCGSPTTPRSRPRGWLPSSRGCRSASRRVRRSPLGSRSARGPRWRASASSSSFPRSPSATCRPLCSRASTNEVGLEFRDDQLHRYARHIILQEVGGVGQARLLDSRVLVVGAGGLGSPALIYLAAAGVGTIGVIDDDRVDLSNLQRQIVHDTARVGQSKVDSAATTLHALNPDVNVERHDARLTVENAAALIGRYDMVADGSDNFATRYLINDACFFAKKTLVSAAILQFDGQLTTFKPHEPGDHPC